MNSTRVHLLFLSLAIFMFVNTAVSHAVVETVEFIDRQTEQRYKDLIAELRCLVCQNQNIAESDADLAKDLRRKTAEMLNAGKSNRHVRNYMRERYGDFVLYKPPFEGLTVILWISPVLLLIILIIGIMFTIKRRQEPEGSSAAPLYDSMQRSKIRELLRDETELDDRDAN